MLQGLRLEYVSRFKAVSILLSVSGSPFVMGNEHGLRQVFRNLIINGIQSMPEGGELNITLIEVVQGRVRCEVRDTGPGIPQEQLENIFTPFYTTKRDGSGLGLAVVAQILRQHDADFGVRDTGTGALFWFEVDRVRREP
jgi:two-component system, sporulation sensor kinase E